MNVCFILMVSIILQLLFGFLMKLLFPGVSSIPFVYYTQLMLLTFVSVFLPSYLYLKDEKKGYFTDCFSSVKPDILFLISALIGVCSQYVGILANLPVRILMDYLGADITKNIPQVDSFSKFLFAVFVMCLLPAIFEEVMFRGIVFNYFRQFGKRSAIIFSALLFGIMHFDFTNFFATFILGLILGYIISLTNRMVYTMIAHFMINFTSVLSSYIVNFEIANNFYIDSLPVLFIVSVPLIIYLISLFKQKAVYMPYHDQVKYETVIENVIPINEESSIKIIEHDIRENNMKLAFKKLYTSPSFYILLMLFIYLGGSDLWK